MGYRAHCALGGRLPGRGRLLLCILCGRLQRKGECEAGSLAKSGSDLDLAPIRFHDLLDDRQAQPCSDFATGFGLISAKKVLKEMGDVLLCDAHARVGDCADESPVVCLK